MFMPILIMGGIMGGIFTATESAAVAVIYAIFVGRFVLKTIKFRDLYQPILSAAKMTASVMFIIAIASAMGWVITRLRIPYAISQFFLAYANNKFIFLLLANILLLLIGMIMDLAPALLIMTPILVPTATALGINPLHFGVMVVVNLCVGLVTPPVGMTLFVTANVAKISLARMYKAILPFIVVEIVALILIVYIPGISTWIPSLFGYV